MCEGFVPSPVRSSLGVFRVVQNHGINPAKLLCQDVFVFFDARLLEALRLGPTAVSRPRGLSIIYSPNSQRELDSVLLFRCSARCSAANQEH